MKKVYDYYVVEIPDDCASEPEERANLAFMELEDRVRLFALPCLWRVVSDDGETVKVCRIRYARKRD